MQKSKDYKKNDLNVLHQREIFSQSQSFIFWEEKKKRPILFALYRATLSLKVINFIHEGDNSKTLISMA